MRPKGAFKIRFQIAFRLKMFRRQFKFTFLTERKLSRLGTILLYHSAARNASV